MSREVARGGRELIAAHLADRAGHVGQQRRVLGAVAEVGVDRLLVELEDLLGHPVDIVTEPGLKARIRQRVLTEAVAV